jgi:Glyoxalase-like domain
MTREIDRNKTLPVTLDHVVVNVLGELDAAEAQYRKLGFHLTERGHHSLGSSNHLAIFGTDYLELLGYEPGRASKRPDLWNHPAGLTGLVFKVPAPDALEADLRKRNVAIEAPAEFHRPVLLADGSHDARFRVIRVAPELVENGRTFFCHHYTPDLVWRSEWQDHPNGVTGIAEFGIASHEPSRPAALYDRMFGPDLLVPTAGGVWFKAGTAKISFLDPATIAQRFGAPPVLGPGDSDRMVGLVFTVKSLDATRNWLVKNDVPHMPFGANGIGVPASTAAGVTLAFTA